MHVLTMVATPMELALFVPALFLLFYRHGVGIAESIALAIAGTLTLLSLLLQTLFLMGLPMLSQPVAVLLALAAFAYCLRYREYIGMCCRQFCVFFGRYPYASTVCSTILFYLALQAFLLPDGNYDSMRYNLARVLLFAQQRSLFLDHVTEYHQSVQPVGGDILSYLPLGLGTDYGVALFSFLAYVAIIFSSYAWARRYASQTVSFSTALLIAGLPLPVFQSTGTKPDILAVMAALACVLLLYRFMEKPSPRYLALLILFLAFGISAKTTFLAFAAPLLCLLVLLRWHFHRSNPQAGLTWRSWLALLLPVLILSQSWLFVHNRVQWGGWFGPSRFVQFHRNRDGIEGAMANATRYLFQSVHLLTPVDLAAWKLTGVRPSATLQAAYNRYFYPLWGDKGAAMSHKRLPFRISGARHWGDDENGAWFGPLGFFLILPAMLFALLRGDLLLRSVVMTLFLYVLLVCYSIAWMPWNGRFVALFFIGSSGAVALLLTRLGKRGVGRRSMAALRCIALMIMLYAAVFNQQKELLNARALLETVASGHLKPGILSKDIWGESDFGRDRNYYTRRFYGDDRVALFAERVDADATVGIYARYLSWIFPFLQSRRDVHFVPLAVAGTRESSLAGMDLSRIDYLLCLNSACRQVARIVGGKVIWQAARPESRISGALIRLHGKNAD